MKEGKPFEISKHQVLEAYKQVKANHGAGGTDGVNFTEFEKDLKSNLYKLWNRMSSGCYFPVAVRGVEIPKKDGRKRLLGIPTVSTNCTKTQSPFGKFNHYSPVSSAERAML